MRITINGIGFVLTSSILVSMMIVKFHHGGWITLLITAMLVIVAPLYVPLVISLGFDPIWYGVLYTISCQIAYITPPFGYNLFLMRAMAPPEISLADIYRSIIPFVFVMIVGMAIIMVFPQIAIWLPQWYYAR